METGSMSLMELGVLDVFLGLLACGALIYMSTWTLLIAERRSGAKLPSGSYGWPLVGETISFLTSSPTDFARPRIHRNGRVFKSHIFGRPTVVVTSADVAHLVHSRPTAELGGGLPETAKTLFGKEALPFLDPVKHDAIHRLVQSFFFFDSLGPRLADIEKLIVKQLVTWEGKTINLEEEAKKLTLNVTMHLFAGFGLEDDSHLVDDILDQFVPYAHGLFCLPINLPGTTYRKALVARKKLEDIVKLLIKKVKRRSASVAHGETLLSALLEFVHEDGTKISDNQICDHVISILFGGYDTTASTTTMAIKHLMDYPHTFELLKAEQEQISRSKDPDAPLTLENLRQMRYTLQVIDETLRFPGIAQMSARVVKADHVDIAGYRIPKGWSIMMLFSGYQQDEAIYPKPRVFNPSRFDEMRMPKTFTPFGGGSNVCPGRELAKIKLRIILHHMATKFSWTLAKPIKPLHYLPVCCPDDGLTITVKKL